MASDYLESIALLEGDVWASLNTDRWGVIASLEHVRVGKTGRDPDNYTIDRECELFDGREVISGDKLAQILEPRIPEDIMVTYRRKRRNRMIFNVYQRQGGR